MKSRGFIGLLVVLIVGLAVLASIGYSAYRNQPGGFTGQIMGQLERPQNILNHIISSFSTSTNSTITVATSASTSASVDTSGWKTYVNTQYGIQIQYPDNWVIENAGNPLILRSDGEFTYCINNQIVNNFQCKPFLAISLPDGSGHGIALYGLDLNKIKQKYGVVPNQNPGVWVDSNNNIQYELVYFDTASPNASDSENTLEVRLLVRWRLLSNLLINSSLSGHSVLLQ